jgi:isopentenyl-diphosphate delta-isomerase
MQLGGRYFDRLTFEHVALPELALEDIDTRTSFVGRPLAAPLLISGMTGGTEVAGPVNRRLAEAAEARGIALGVGSQRGALHDEALVPTFQVRPSAPSVPILANLGAVQLNEGYGLAECRAAVDMVGADALVLHLNVLQEALQPEGQTNFRGLLPAMGRVARALGVPVVAKEVGNGISAGVARALVAEGITIVDVAGSGGTSWARIEARRSGATSTGEAFASWGIPTPRAIRDVAGVDGVTVIGSGGLRSGVDVAKALALGASLAGLAHPFLEAAMESTERVIEVIDRIVRELRVAMLCVGAADLEQLRRAPLTEDQGPWINAQVR